MFVYLCTDFNAKRELDFRFSMDRNLAHTVHFHNTESTQCCKSNVDSVTCDRVIKATLAHLHLSYRVFLKRRTSYREIL